MVKEMAKLHHYTYLPVTSASATSSSASASITKLARPFVLHEHITSDSVYVIRDSKRGT